MSTILLVGGGTLGSVNPLLAVASALKRAKPGTVVHFWGSRRGLERQVVGDAGIPFSAIPAGKLRRYFSLRTLVDVPVIAWATLLAWTRLRRLHPALVVSAGSYVAVPVAWAARALRIPVLLYQQDATLGLANRLIAGVSRIRTATTEQAAHLLKPPVTVVGFALRADLYTGDRDRAAAAYGLDVRRPALLVIGGSSGALGMNQKFGEALPFLHPDLQVVHITGTGKEIQFQRKGYVQIPFTNAALPDLYALATVVVSRAGSNVLAELVALRKPLVIIPLPHSHQVQNAVVFEERGIPVRDQNAVSGQSLASDLNALCFDPQQLQKLSQAVSSLWDTDGAHTLVALMSPYL